MVQEGGRKVSYRGSTLAAELRARFPELPIVLITSQGVLGDLNVATERQLRKHMPDFDTLIKKDTFEKHPERTPEDLFRIAEGFHQLKTTSRSWDGLSGVLGASREEKELLQETAPPLFGDRWVTVEAAEWIRNTVLRFPGILYDPIHAATHLGISRKSFEKSEVQELLHEAAYDGIFAPTKGRWWRRRLTMIAKQLASDVQVSGPVNQAFRLAFHKRHGIDLDPALCIWDGTPVADWVCCLRNEPVKIQHSLRYYPDYPDQRSAVMDEARISYRAIYEDEFDEDLVDPDERELIREIMEMTDPRES